MTKAFHELGYVEGKNIELDHRFPAEQPERFRMLAQELIDSKVDMIVAVTSLAAKAAKQVTGTIPIVLVADPDPVGAGFAVSLARPGGNATGLSLLSFDTAGKRLEYFGPLGWPVAQPSFDIRMAIVGSWLPQDIAQKWMATDLKAFITARAGPEFIKGPRSIEAGVALAGSERRWTVAGIISDRQTETDIAAGRSPSYGVAVKRADGALALFGVARGDPSDKRLRFDPTGHIERYSEQLQADFKRISLNRSMRGGDSDGFMNMDREFHTTDRPSYLFGEALPE